MTSPPTLTIDETILETYRTLQEPGQGDIVTEFIDVFLEDLPSRLANIRKAVMGGTPQAIRSAAHALKGSGGSIGAIRLASLCGELETLGRSGQADGTSELLTAIEQEAAQAREALSRFRR